MKPIKLLIADSDTTFTEHFSLFLKSYPDIDLIACEANGQDALHFIQSQHPDVVLFDLLLPGLDGLSLLRSAKGTASPPVMICCTRFFSDVSMEAMRTFGADYLLYKPVELHTLHAVILSCVQLHRQYRTVKRNLAAMDEAASSAEIRNYIVSLGIPTKLIGCSYLTEALRLAAQDETLLRNLSKGLYLEISRSMNTTPVRVERCIRNAISIAFQSGSLDSRMTSCPSNKEFISYALRNMRL